MDRFRDPIGTDSPFQGVHSTVMYSDIFPEGPDCCYVGDFSELPVGEGAIVFVNGSQRQPDTIVVLNEHILRLPWVVVVSVMEENSQLPLDQLVHPNMRIWVEEPKPGANPNMPAGIPHIGALNHDNMRRIPTGYSRWVKTVPSLDYKSQDIWRPLDWFFSGNHYDEVWSHAIAKLPGGKFYEVDRSQVQGARQIYALSPELYMRYLLATKCVPCRPAKCVPETGRTFEALEAGCIPIVARYPAAEGWRLRYDWSHYWEYVLGEEPPFPIIDGPEQLPDALEKILSGWPENAREVRHWWIHYKWQLFQDLRQEVLVLRAKVLR